MNLKQVIAIIAIICGVVFHGRLLIGLVNDLPHDHQGFSKFLLPFYAFTTSLSLFGVLGLFDLTKRKRGEILLWTAIGFSSLAMIVSGFLVSIASAYFFAGGLAFGMLHCLPRMIKPNVNPNLVTATMNVFTICVTPLIVPF